MTLNFPALKILKAKFVATDNEPSSVTEQGWDVKILDFGLAKTEGVDYFNPSYVALPEREFLIARCSIFDPKVHVGINSLMGFSMTDREPKVAFPLKPFELGNNNHFEDPRAIYHDGHVYIGCCTFTWSREHGMWSGAHQSLFKFKPEQQGWQQNWKCLDRWDIQYGFNEKNLTAPRGHEKNWNYFICDGEFYLLYKTHPHTVVKLDKNMKPVTEFVTDWDASRWKHGEPRGGTPPIIGPDGNYWSFFHSSIDKAVRDKRRYYTGCYSFEPKPPFRVLQCTPESILTGSRRDRWSPGKPAVVFAGGAALKKGVWTLAFGINDADSAIGYFPHWEVLKRVRPV
jgi:predicted GH43/DUF377 family glycosyl hydrolase